MYSAKIEETYKPPNKENIFCDSSASHFYLNEKFGHKLINKIVFPPNLKKKSSTTSIFCLCAI